jgi:hypothetical protein
LVAAICLGLMVASARGGNLDAPAAPTNATSAMWTLNDIYNVLNTRTTNVALRTGGFTEPTGGPTNGTMHALDEIMSLVTVRAAVPKTGQTAWYRSVREDGATKIGVAWPNPRFTVVGASGPETNQIRDNLTGLIWARNANLASNTVWSVDGTGTCYWAEAFNVITNSAGPVNGANYGGTNDWRLPNVRELSSLISFGYSTPALCNTAGAAKWTENDPFTRVQCYDPGTYWTQPRYWTSTAYVDSVTDAWYVRMSEGAMYNGNRTTLPCFVWPVRGGR